MTLETLKYYELVAELRSARKRSGRFQNALERILITRHPSSANGCPEGAPLPCLRITEPEARCHSCIARMALETEDPIKPPTKSLANKLRQLREQRKDVRYDLQVALKRVAVLEEQVGKAEQERDEAIHVRDLAREASNRDLEAKRRMEVEAKGS